MPRVKPPPNAKLIRTGPSVLAAPSPSPIRRRIDREGLMCSESGGAEKALIFNFLISVPVRLFLAGNTKGCPRQSLQSFQRDLFFTVRTYAITTVGNPI